DHTAQQVFEPHDGVDIVTGGIHANDDIASAVGEAFQDGKEDLLLLIARAIGLDARAKMVRGAKRDALSWQWTVERPGDTPQVLIGHDFDYCSNDFARQTSPIVLRPLRTTAAQEDTPQLSYG